MPTYQNIHDKEQEKINKYDLETETGKRCCFSYNNCIHTYSKNKDTDKNLTNRSGRL